MVDAQLLQASSPTVLLGLLCIAGSTREKQVAVASNSRTGFSGWQRCLDIASRQLHTLIYHVSLFINADFCCTFCNCAHGPIQTKRLQSKRPEVHARLVSVSVPRGAETGGLRTRPRRAITESRPTCLRPHAAARVSRRSTFHALPHVLKLLPNLGTFFSCVLQRPSSDSPLILALAGGASLSPAAAPR